MDERDRDILARTIVGEAANQPFEGQQAVANVVLNRLRSGKYGGSVADVVFAPYQFEPWQTRRPQLEALRPDSPAYQRASQAIDAALSGDVTGGKTHFLEPNIVRQRRGGTLPAWAQGPSQQIGSHLFFAPDGKQAAAAGASVQPYAPVAQLPPVVPEPQPAVVAGGSDILTVPAHTSTTPLTFAPAPRQIANLPEDTGDGSTLFGSAFEPRTTKRARPARTQRST